MHSFVVASDVEEELAVSPEQAPGHGGRGCGVFGRSGLFAAVGYPSEVTRPGEASNADVNPSWRAVELQTVMIDAINGRDDDRCWVVLDSLQKRLDPALGGLTMRVQEDDDITRSNLGTRVSSPNQASLL